MSFDKWRARLAGEKVRTSPQPDHEDEGYYRKPITEKQANGRNKIVGWIPVAFFLEEGKLVGVLGAGDDAKDLSVEDCEDVWTWCVQYPVFYQQYLDVTEHGKPWFDAEPVSEIGRVTTTVAQVGTQAVPAANREVDRSDNLPPPEEELPLDKQHAEAIDAAISVANFKVTNETEAAAALGSKNRIAELRLAADKEGKAIYEPLFRIYTVEQKKWPGMIGRAADAEKKLNSAVLTFREGERQKLLKAQREAEEAQRKIDEANQRAADRAIAAGQPEPAPVVVEPVTPPPAAPEPVRPTYGTRGIKEDVKRILDAITDYDAVYAFLKDDPDVKALLLKLATAKVKAGLTVPGTTTREGLI